MEFIVCRPRAGDRLVFSSGMFTKEEGLVGDDWIRRGSHHTEDGSSDPDMQVTLMNSRVISVIAGSRDRWQLAGDQLYVDLDWSVVKLPFGQKLQVGNVVLEISTRPHTGGGKFSERFGKAARQAVNSAVRVAFEG